MTRNGSLALGLVAALLLPLGGGVWASEHACCSGAQAGVCPYAAKPHPAKREQHATAHRADRDHHRVDRAGPGREGCHETAPSRAQIRCRQHCSSHGDPIAAPLRDEHRSPAVRLHARVTLLPRDALAAAPAPALEPGFSEPPTPPPRRSV
jgi:hypothetical protein